MEPKVPDDFTLELTLFNFGSSIGQGSQKPLEIGHMGGKAIFLHYRVYAAPSSIDKELHFTIFQNKEPLAKKKEEQPAKPPPASGEEPKANG